MGRSGTRVRVRYEPLGAARELFSARAPEVLLAGPAGTGKSRACLEKLHLCAVKYGGMRGLIVRKTRASITESAMVTFGQRVLNPLDGVRFNDRAQEYRYPNGSVVVVAGLDKTSKVMSSEYDLAYVQEATELRENEWEALTTRLRNGVMPYQQIIADCNPEGPGHWLRARAETGRVAMLESRLEDNPGLWDRGRGAWTERGAAYVAKLDALTGVRYLRLRKGIWAAAEGLVFDGWDREAHLVERFEVPAEWPRFWVVDFGYTHPFVWQAWTEDPDGRLLRYREIYQTGRLVEDHAKEITRVTRGEPRPKAVICDHDAEGRATLERHLQVRTVAAYKAVVAGIQAVASRLRPAGDGRARLLYLRDSLVRRDPGLVERKVPTCTEEEFETYVWDVAGGRKRGEEPVKQDDHGMDGTRYMVAYRDLVARRRAEGRGRRDGRGER